MDKDVVKLALEDRFRQELSSGFCEDTAETLVGQAFQILEGLGLIRTEKFQAVQESQEEE